LSISKYPTALWTQIFTTVFPQGHWILRWIGQGPHPCNTFLLYDKFTYYPHISDC